MNIRKNFALNLAKDLNFRYIELQELLRKWAARAKSEQIKNLDQTSLDNAGHDLCFPNANNDCSSNPLFDIKICYDTTHPFKTDKILDLLKFAMMEGLPCEGFIIDCFPCNLEEADKFEQIFYPAAMGIFFVAGTLKRVAGHPIQQRTIRGRRRKKIPAGTDPILYPQTLKRRHQYTHRDAIKICNVYGRKIARIIEAEDIDAETLGFLNELVRSNLERYSDLLQGQTRLACNFGNKTSFVTSESEGYETVRSSPSSAFQTPSPPLRKHRVKKQQQQIPIIPLDLLPPPLISIRNSLSSLAGLQKERTIYTSDTNKNEFLHDLRLQHHPNLSIITDAESRTDTISPSPNPNKRIPSLRRKPEHKTNNAVQRSVGATPKTGEESSRTITITEPLQDTNSNVIIRNNETGSSPLITESQDDSFKIIMRKASTAKRPPTEIMLDKGALGDRRASPDLLTSPRMIQFMKTEALESIEEIDEWFNLTQTQQPINNDDENVLNYDDYYNNCTENIVPEGKPTERADSRCFGDTIDHHQHEQKPKR
jgi:hypothetical protein